MLYLLFFCSLVGTVSFHNNHKLATFMHDLNCEQTHTNTDDTVNNDNSANLNLLSLIMIVRKLS